MNRSHSPSLRSKDPAALGLPDTVSAFVVNSKLRSEPGHAEDGARRHFLLLALFGAFP